MDECNEWTQGGKKGCGSGLSPATGEYVNGFTDCYCRFVFSTESSSVIESRIRPYTGGAGGGAECYGREGVAGAEKDGCEVKIYGECRRATENGTGIVGDSERRK